MHIRVIERVQLLHPASPSELTVSLAVGFVCRLGGKVRSLIGGDNGPDTRRVKGSDFRWVAAVGVAVAALLLPAAAGAHRGDGVFRLADTDLSYGANDVAMLADGSVVVHGVFDGAWRIAPDGDNRPFPGLLAPDLPPPRTAAC